MPIIKASSELRNHYNEMIELSKETNEPIYLTKNGQGDAVLLSMEAYKELLRDQLMGLLQPGIDDIKEGRTQAAEEVFAELAEEFGFKKI